MRKSCVGFLILLFSHFPLLALDDAAMAYGECTDRLMRETAPADTVEICRRGVGSGLPGAFYAVGIAMLMEEGRPNLTEAITWLQKAADAGHPSAALRLASFELRSEDEEARSRGRKHFNFAYCSGQPEALKVAPKTGLTAAELECDRSNRTDMTGSWTSQLAWVTPKPTPDAGDLDLRVTVSSGAVQVFSKSGEAWNEVKPGTFTMSEHHGTLIARSLDSGWDLDGEWVESWTIHLQRLGENEAEMSLLRSVNNVHIPASSEWKTFTYLWKGPASRK